MRNIEQLRPGVHPTATIRQRGRLVASFVVAAFVLAGCGPTLFMFGDSQSAMSSRSLNRAFNSDYQLWVKGKPSCGLLPNATTQCPGPVDWHAEYDEMVEKRGTPAVVIVELGFNDASSYPPEAIATLEPQAIRDFVAHIPSGIPVVWANLPYVAPWWNPNIDANMQAVNTALAQVDSELDQLHVVDLRSHFAGHFPTWFGDDQWHYNETGQREFASFMCRATDQFDLLDHAAACETTSTAAP